MAPIVKADHLLWIDLETTGLDPDDDCILEIGFIYTDLELNELVEGTFLCAQDLPRSLVHLNEFTQEMHFKSGLLTDLSRLYEHGDPPTLEEIEDAILARMPREHTIALAGSGVAHMDRGFINIWMPRLAKRLEYYCIDTGILRRCLRIFGGAAYDIEDMPQSYDTDVKAHRALDDVKAHLLEARAYRDKLGEVGELAWQYKDLSSS